MKKPCPWTGLFASGRRPQSSACNPLRDTLAHFGQAYAQRTGAAQFEPEFNLDAELSVARRATGRNDPGAHLHTETLP